MRAPSYLWKRGSSFFFQFAIPVHLIETLGRTPFRSRIPVTDPKLALKIARVLSFRVEHLLMSALSGLPKRGRLPLPNREFVKGAIEKELEDLHLALLEVEKGPSAPDLRTAAGKLEHERRRSEALAAALRAVTAKAHGVVEDWDRDIRKANELNSRLTNRVDELDSVVGEYGEESAAAHGHLKIRTDQLREQHALRASDDRLLKLVDVMSDQNAELISENKKINARLDFRGPKLSKCLERFLAHVSVCGVSEKEQKNLKRRGEIFIEVVGDKEIANYNISDLQKFANDLTFLPERHRIARHWKNKAVSEIIKEVKEGKAAGGIDYLTESTIATGYIGRVKQILRYLCAAYEVPYPFEAYSRVKIQAKKAAAVRHGLESGVINRILQRSAEAQEPEVVFGPLFALLTGMRIGEMVGLHRHDLIEQHGVWILNLTLNSQLGMRQLKSDNSRRFVTLHRKLTEIGFVDWACSVRSGPLFAGFQSAQKPANAASKKFQRLFQSWDLHGLEKMAPEEKKRKKKSITSRTEVFHALRHTYKDLARSAGIEERTIALQTGHSLQGVALSYGTKATRQDEREKLRDFPLPASWDFTPFDGISDRKWKKRRKHRPIVNGDSTVHGDGKQTLADVLLDEFLREERETGSP